MPAETESNLTDAIIRTNRLVLRPPQVADAEVMFERWGRYKEVVRFLSWGPNKNVDEVRGLITSSQKAWDDGHKYSRLLTLEDEVIGMIDLRDHGFKADIGFILAPEFQHRGYMTEAVVAVVDGALLHPRIYSVWGECDSDNYASALVMRRAKMEQFGVLPRWIVDNENDKQEPRDALLFMKYR